MFWWAHQVYIVIIRVKILLGVVASVDGISLWLLPSFISEVTFYDEVKGKGAHEPKAPTARAYPGFLSVKHT